MHKKGNRITLACIPLILIVAFVLGWGFRRYYFVLTNEAPNGSGKLSARQRISLEQASHELGCNIPLPTHLPPGYVLDGIYMYPSIKSTPETTDAKLPPRPPVEPFYVTFKGGTHVLVLWLYGGDTRNEESRANTGGDIPASFNLDGITIEVNGGIGLLQTDLNESNFDWATMHTRVIWRFPCTSQKMADLNALFLALESDGIPPSDLLEIARSVH